MSPADRRRGPPGAIHGRAVEVLRRVAGLLTDGPGVAEYRVVAVAVVPSRDERVEDARSLQGHHMVGAVAPTRVALPQRLAARDLLGGHDRQGSLDGERAARRGRRVVIGVAPRLAGRGLPAADLDPALGRVVPLTTTVVVDQVVAQLGRAGVGRGVVVVAVVVVGDPVGVGLPLAVGEGVLAGAVAVAIKVAVVGDVDEALIDAAIAVVVETIADLGRAVMPRGIIVSTVGAVGVAVTVGVDRAHARVAVRIGVGVRVGVAVGVGVRVGVRVAADIVLVDLSVAVVVAIVADLRRARVGPAIEVVTVDRRAAVRRGEVAIVVVVVAVDIGIDDDSGVTGVLADRDAALAASSQQEQDQGQEHVTGHFHAL